MVSDEKFMFEILWFTIRPFITNNISFWFTWHLHVVHCCVPFFLQRSRTRRASLWTGRVQCTSWIQIPSQDNNGYKNEDLIVWMRTAALPTFRKLHRRVQHEGTIFKDGAAQGKLHRHHSLQYPWVTHIHTHTHTQTPLPSATVSLCSTHTCTHTHTHTYTTGCNFLDSQTYIHTFTPTLSS